MAYTTLQELNARSAQMNESRSGNVEQWWDDVHSLFKTDKQGFLSWEQQNPEMAVRWHSRAQVPDKSSTAYKALAEAEAFYSRFGKVLSQAERNEIISDPEFIRDYGSMSRTDSSAWGDSWNPAHHKSRGQQIAYAIGQELGYGDDGTQDGRAIASNFDQMSDVNSEWGSGDFWKIGTPQKVDGGIKDFLEEDWGKLVIAAGGYYIHPAVGGAIVDRMSGGSGIGGLTAGLEGIGGGGEGGGSATGPLGYLAGGLNLNNAYQNEQGDEFGESGDMAELGGNEPDWEWGSKVADAISDAVDSSYGNGNNNDVSVDYPNPAGDYKTNNGGMYPDGPDGPPTRVPPGADWDWAKDARGEWRVVGNDGTVGPTEKEVTSGNVDWDKLVDTGIGAAKEYFENELIGQSTRRAVEQGTHKYQDLNIPGFGDVGWRGGKGSISNLNPQAPQIVDESLRGALSALTNRRTQSAVDTAYGIGSDALPNAALDALQTDSFNPAMNLYDQQQKGLFQGGDQLLKQFTGRNLLDDVGRERDAAYQNGLFQSGVGRGLIQNSDFQTLADQRLGLLRQQANPYERMQTNRVRNELANTGNLHSKAGTMRQGALDLSQGTADLERQLQSQTMADDMRRFNLTTGSSLLAGGTDSFGTAGNLFSQGAGAETQFGNVANNTIGTLGNIASQGLDGRLRGTQLENTRGQQRLKTTQDLLNFGQQFDAGRSKTAGGYLSNFNDMNDAFLNMYNTSAAPGSVNNSSSIPLGGNSSGENALKALLDMIEGMR